MDDVMSPFLLDPTRAMKEAITSLEEQAKVRGPAIFETSGAWEDISTPSRDLWLLIATDVVLGFLDRVARRSERYAMPKDTSAAEVKAELQRVLASELATRKFSYPRGDGSAWDADAARRHRHAVRPRDGVQPQRLRRAAWGAPPKSDEASTCKRYAPAAQRDKMSKYRAWFHEPRRPPQA